MLEKVTFPVQLPSGNKNSVVHCNRYLDKLLGKIFLPKITTFSDIEGGCRLPLLLFRKRLDKHLLVVAFECPKERKGRDLRCFPALHFYGIQFVSKQMQNFDFFFLARLIKVERPLYGVEVFVGETARFEIEISEPDVHPVWKLKGETLTPSPVRILLYF